MSRRPNDEDQEPVPRRSRIRPLELAVPPDVLRPLHDRLGELVAAHPELAQVVAAMNEPTDPES